MSMEILMGVITNSLIQQSINSNHESYYSKRNYHDLMNRRRDYYEDDYDEPENVFAPFEGFNYMLQQEIHIVPDDHVDVTVRIINDNYENLVKTFSEDGAKGEYEQVFSLKDEAGVPAATVGRNGDQYYPLRVIKDEEGNQYVHEYPGYDNLIVREGHLYGTKGNEESEIYYPIAQKKLFNSSGVKRQEYPIRLLQSLSVEAETSEA